MRRFNARAFVSLTAALSGLGLPITGLAMHRLSDPPASTAQHAWMSAHNVPALVFTVFAVWHVLLNRRPLWCHLRHAAAQVVGVSREALLALVVVGLALLFVCHAFLLG